MKLINLLFCLLAITQLHAQQLHGTITDPQNQPRPYVLVVLATDSTYTKDVISTITTESGTYSFQNIKAGQYYLRANFLGLKTYTNKVTLPGELNIIMTDSSSQLNEIVVKSQKPTFQKLTDKFVFNVANSTITAGGTAYDVLTHTPLLIPGTNGNLNIAGFPAGATVYINNRKSLLTGDDLMTYLKGMSADNIISVEVITNPSAKYEAGASGGIINILLKKTEDEGLNGTLTLSDRQNKFNEQRISGLLNYKKRRYAQQFQLTATNSKNFIQLNATTLYPKINETESLNTEVNSTNKDIYAKTAIDYECSSKINIGGAVEYKRNTNKAIQQTLNNIQYPTYTDSLLNHGKEPGNNNILNSNLYFKFNDAKKGRSLDLNADGIIYNNNDNSEFLSYYRNKPSDIFNGYKSNIKQEIHNYSFKADYAQKFIWKTTLEAGGKYTYTETKNPYNFYNLDIPSNEYIFNPGISNYFIYQEKIIAAYLNLQKSFTEKISLKAGVRMESTSTTNIQKITNKNDYTRWLPSAMLNYAINDNHNLSFALKSDFNRPAFWQMNPFMTYTSNKSGVQGNPFIKPTQSIHAELTYVHHQHYIFMASYGKEKNLFQQVVTLIQPDTLIYYWNNYGFSKSLALTSVINKTILKDCWTASMTNALEWRTLHVTANGVASENTYPLYMLNINNNFSNIAHTGIDATVSGSYFNQYAQANMLIKSFGNINIGVSKNFPKPAIKVSLAVDDILYTSYFRFHTLPNDQMINTAVSKSSTRMVRVSLMKKFGNKKMKKFNSNDSGNQQEQNRI
ncbi:outer membrane beta-barrel family protein [Chitinophaga sancti]|uniref:outer membrane beta-barrel family protein n=1 Tax=Chitinophaga sancti TaxID=1004 RepID=UPI002A759261|nr:outer membrane beta-barrel family protein [Chitinophaga sancti]WPQ63434.1 outer membrane beta-barrel family protein [Chitinophaga sancti]